MPVTIAKLAEPLPSIILPQHEILEGEPRAGGQFTAESADGNASAGFWSCGVGRYQFQFDYDEFVYLIRGEIMITELGGVGSNATYTLRAGDTAHFPQGVTTIWQITQPVLKYFVARAPF
jgi:uncharacterized cupin superfamily protein